MYGMLVQVILAGWFNRIKLTIGPTVGASDVRKNRSLATILNKTFPTLAGIDL